MRTEFGTIINPDGSTRVVHPANHKKFTLAELQRFVEGYIELVPLRPGNGRGQMYVNEDGKIKGLSPNAAATMIAHIYPGDMIVGNAIIVRKEDHDTDGERGQKHSKSHL